MEFIEPRRLLAATITSAKSNDLQTIGHDLVNVFSQYNNYAKNPTPGLSVAKFIARSNRLIHTQGKSVAIDARASGDSSVLVTDLASIGATNIRRYGSSVSALVPFASIGALSGLDSMSQARPVYARTSTGSVNAQSDNAIRSVNARTTYGADGTGVKVGILSDSFNTSGDGSYATDIATGDLPNNVQIIEDYTDTTYGTSDEGRAMAQLVYDSAPGASLAFATAYTGQAGFAANINALQAAGSKVIVDDVFYLDEPFFQDGPVAQAVDNVVASGTAYFSAAGNQARQSYDSAWRPGIARAGGSITASFFGGTTFDFDPGAGVDDMNSFILTNGASVSITIQWDEPAAIAGGTTTTKDLDMYLLNSAGTQVLASSVDDNIGGDPVEIIQFQNTSGVSTTVNLMIARYTAIDPGRIKYIDFDGQGFGWQYGFNSGTLVGHANSATGAGVAASRYTTTPAYGVNPPTTESYSSYGQVPILFDTAGNRLVSAITRQQPMITGVDGVDTTFFGQAFDSTPAPNFFGTSAAAPTAAAVAALMIQKVPSITPAQIYTAMKNTTVDMDDTSTVGFDAGFDYLTGFGLVRADNALASLTGSVSGNVSNDLNSDGIFNGSDSAITGVTVFADLNSNGSLDSGEASAITDLSGNYIISGLFPALTTIRQVVPAGYVPTNPSTATMTASVTTGVTLSNNNFYNFAYNISGTSSNESYYVRGSSSLTQIWVGAVPPTSPNYSVPINLLTAGLTINGMAGDDALVIDYSLGNPIPTAGLSFDGGASTIGDTIDIRGSGISDIFTLPSASMVILNSKSATYSSIESIKLSAGTFDISANLNNENLNVSGSTSVANFTIDQNLNNLTIASGAVVSSASTNAAELAMTLNSLNIDSAVLAIELNGGKSGVTKTKSISVIGSGWLELHDNDLIVDYTGNPSPYSAILNYVKSGLFLLGGNGLGISSTEVDAQNLMGTVLAVVDGGALGDGGITSLSGAEAPEASILVKYTWFGDSNLDGAVTGDDYALIDTGFTSGGLLNGWIFGDYDFDGIISSGDYALIDTGFISQTSVL